MLPKLAFLWKAFRRTLSLLQIDSVSSATFAFSSSTNHDVESFFARKGKNDLTNRWKSVAKPLEKRGGYAHE
jgi:hypothetical protein